MDIENLPIHDRIKKILKAEGIEKLNPPQIEAVKKGLLEKKNLVIASPTASGKTLIAELAFLKNFLSNGKTIYLVPLKALGSEKFADFKKYESLGMRIALSLGDLDSTDKWLGSYDLIILSNEKMDSLLRHEASWINNVNLVIADEIHLLDDPSRGPTLEIILTRLKSLRAQILALSATIQNAEEIAQWLKAGLVKSDYRPIKLKKGVSYNSEESLVIDYDEGKQYLDFDENSEISICKDTIANKKQALIFLATRRNAEAAAEKIGLSIKALLTEGEKKELEKISDDIEKALSSPTRQCRKLASFVKNGAAFHHAGLVAKQRKIIEDNFKAGTIKFITATPTLVFGMNLPAWRVIVRDPKRFSGYGADFLSVMEMHQMFGRAGRPKYDSEGEAIIVGKTESDAEFLKNRYIYGEPEPVYSKLSVEPALRIHTLALIAAGVTKSKSSLKEFFSNTLFAHQYGDIDEVMTKVEKILKQLQDFNFIKTNQENFIDDEFIPAFELNSDVELKPTKIGRRVSELYLDPLSANWIINNLRKMKELEHLMVLNQCIEMSPLLRIKKNEYEDMEELLATSALKGVPDAWDIDYDGYIMAFKTSLMFMDWMNEMGEDKILDKYDFAPGELYNKITNADWILYAASELALLMEKKDIANSLNKLRLRVKHGIREELLKLIALKNIGRVRARALWKNGIKTPADIKNAEKEKLDKILGPKIANSILQQIG